MVLERLTKEDGIDMNVLMAIWFMTVLIVLDPFLSDPGVPGVRSMGSDVRQSVQDYLQT